MLIKTTSITVAANSALLKYKQNRLALKLNSEVHQT